MNCSTPGLPVHHQLLEFTQTHIHRVSDAIHPSHPLSSPSPLAPNPSQHQSAVLSPLVLHGLLPLDTVEQLFGTPPRTILCGLLRIQELYRQHPTISTHASHLRDLLLSFVEDMRVILIMIANRLIVMRAIRDTDNLKAREQVAAEAAYLYAPLAHKLGLYAIKSELEDLSLKYLSPEPYYHIREKLASTKQARDRYIDSFIGPVRQRLQEAGLHFHIKGRTKSIHSVYQKMKKQRCPFEGVYDLFAIRVILDSPPEREKMDCWQAYTHLQTVL